HAVEADALEPDRVGPELDAHDEHEDDEDDRDDDHGGRELRSDRRRSIARAAARPTRTATPAAATAASDRRPTAQRAESRRLVVLHEPWPGGGPERSIRFAVVGVAGFDGLLVGLAGRLVGAAVSIAIVGSARPSTCRFGLTTPKLLHELVEEITHLVGESSLGARKPLRGSAERGQDGLGQLVRTHRRRPHRLPAEGGSGPDRAFQSGGASPSLPGAAGAASVVGPGSASTVWGGGVSGRPPSTAESAARASASAWAFATWASSSSRSISRRTSAGGGARDPGVGAASSSPSSYSPLIHDKSRPPRGRVRPPERALRRIASASIAVRPGTAASPSPTRVAPHDGQVVSCVDGRVAEHHMQRYSGVVSPGGVASSSMPLTLTARSTPRTPRFG